MEPKNNETEDRENFWDRTDDDEPESEDTTEESTTDDDDTDDDDETEVERIKKPLE